MSEPEDKIFGLPVELILVLFFIAIFVTLVYIMTPQLGGGWVASLFNALRGLSKFFGGF